MRKLSKKAVAVMLAVGMMLSLPLSALAAEENTPKQEVVYVNLNHDGSVSDIYVVNIFDMDEKGKIVDYGSYSALRDMTSTSDIGYDNGKVTIDAGKGKLYYEGTLDSKVMPWNFDIRYFLDGKEYSSDEVAGKSGALKITMSVRKNPECTGSFFDDYALQTSFTLDTNQCENIVAEGATQANVGKNRQLTYTILPGKEEDIEITANVTDFEMPSVAINGISLSLNVAGDDEELMVQVYELLDGIQKLDDGAGELHDGVGELQDGVENDLQSGAVELDDGAGELHDGASELRDGGIDLNDGTFDLKDGMEQLDEGIRKLDEGILQVDDALRELDSNSDTLTNGSAQVKEALHTIRDALKQVSVNAESIDQLVESSAAIKAGIDKLAAGAAAAQGAVSYDAYAEKIPVGTLKDGNQQAIDQLQGLISQLDSQIALLEKLNKFPSRPFLSTVSQQPTVADRPETDVENGEQNGSQTTDETTTTENTQTGAETTEGEIGGAQTENPESKAQEETTDALQPQAEQVTELADWKSGGIVEEQVDALSLSSTLIDQLKSIRDQLNTLATLLEGNNAAIDGTKVYFDTVYGEMGNLVDGANELQSKYAEFDAAIGQIAELLKKMLPQVEELKEGINTLTEQYDLLDQGIQDYTDGVGKILEGYTQLTDGASDLVDGSKQLCDGSGDLYDGTKDLLEGIVEFYNATGTLKDGTGELNEGVADLLAGIITLNDGAVELKDGTGEMREKTDGMDSKITDKIDEMIESISGGDKEVRSFASEQNTNIESVQFVIKTDPIEKPEVEQQAVVAEENLNFWQKLLRLFGVEKEN